MIYKKKLISGIIVCICTLLGLYKFVVPSKNKELANDQTLDTLVAHKVIPIHSWIAGPGTKVVFVPSVRTAMLDIELSFDASATRDPEYKSGLAALTAFALIECVPKSNVAATYHVNLEKDRAQITLSTFNSSLYLTNAINVTSNMISSPDFSSKVINKAKERLLAYNTKNKKLASRVLEQEFYKIMYLNHPYSKPEYGNNLELQNITLADVQEFYNKYYTAKNLVITMLGNISRNQARQLSERLIANLAIGVRAKSIQPLNKINANMDKDLLFATADTQVLIGYPSIKAPAADWASALVGNYILSDHGLDTKLQSIYNINDFASNFMLPMGAQDLVKLKIYTKPSKKSQVKLAAVAMLQNFFQNGPNVEEVTMAKKALINTFPLRFSNDKKILQQVSKLAYYNYPLTFFDDFVAKVNKVSANSIKAALQAKIDLDNLTMVTIGNAT